jgi:signal transduction protein with GAF and PtsI domain
MLIERGDMGEGGEHRDVLEAYRMFANDHGWLRRLREAVATGLTAEAAVERVQSDTRAKLLRQTDPYLRERLHDLDDLANRLMRQLTGRNMRRARGRCPTTPSSSPAQWARRRCSTMTASACAASCWKKAGRSSHVAIVARALGIPAVGEVANAAGPRRARRRDHRRRHRRGASISADPTSRTPMPSGVRFAPGGRSNIARCATSPGDEGRRRIELTSTPAC